MYIKNLKINHINSIISPSLTLGLLIITLGLYSIYWFIITNKILEQIDNNAPNTTRGIILLFILPLFTIIPFKIFQILIKNNTINFILTTINILIILLILKYLFEFNSSFEKITKTNKLIYFIFLSFSIILLYLPILNIKLIIIGIIILITTIVFMQLKLKNILYKYNIKKEKKNFYN